MSLCLTFEAHIVVFSETSICTVSFCTAGGLLLWETPHHRDCFHSTHLPLSFLRISDKEGGPDYEVLASIWPMAITFCFRVVKLNISASSLAVTICLCIIASIIVASSKERANILHLVTIVIVHWHLSQKMPCVAKTGFCTADCCVLHSFVGKFPTMCRIFGHAIRSTYLR